MDTRSSTRQIGQFEADGSDGKKYKVIETREFTRHRDLSGIWSDSKASGISSYELEDGTKVFKKANGTFDVDGTDVVLTPTT